MERYSLLRVVGVVDKFSNIQEYTSIVEVTSRAQYCKHFYTRNLRTYVVSKSV
jgi:hypothetical protein